MDKQITYISAYRSKFQAKQAIGAELWHAAIHIVVDGKTQVWEFGRYNGDGILQKRNKGKSSDQQLITSCQLHNPLSYSQFVAFSKNYCQGKSWGYAQTPKTTHCQFYAFRVLQKYTTPQCANLMANQFLKNFKEGVQQAASHYAQKAKITLQAALQAIMDLLIPPLH